MRNVFVLIAVFVCMMIQVPILTLLGLTTFSVDAPLVAMLYIASTGPGVVGMVIERGDSDDAWEAACVVFSAAAEPVEVALPPGIWRVYVAGDAGSFPGPDWMPKQAHMADLQAEAAVENLLAELAGGKPEKTFKVELLCIVDSLDSGMLVKRTPEGGFALPPLGPMHTAKAFFESWYLRRYR